MNRKINMFGKTIPVWIALATMVGAGSLAIAVSGNPVHQELPPDIQETSDVKIHLQKVDGKIITNVPVSASRINSPLPVVFTESANQPTCVAGQGTPFQASNFQTPQKAVINCAFQVSTQTLLKFKVDNNSADAMNFVLHCNAPPHVILNAVDESGGIRYVGLTGHNEFLMNAPAATNQDMTLKVYTADGGFFPIVCHINRSG